jgi:hypothetical protein
MMMMKFFLRQNIKKSLDLDRRSLFDKLFTFSREVIDEKKKKGSKARKMRFLSLKGEEPKFLDNVRHPI